MGFSVGLENIKEVCVAGDQRDIISPSLEKEVAICYKKL